MSERCFCFLSLFAFLFLTRESNLKLLTRGNGERKVPTNQRNERNEQVWRSGGWLAVWRVIAKFIS
jgi:hypothetical protein